MTGKDLKRRIIACMQSELPRYMSAEWEALAPCVVLTAEEAARAMSLARGMEYNDYLEFEDLLTPQEENDG